MLLGLNQATDIAELEGEILAAAMLLIARHARGMIGHQEILIADFAIDFQRLDEIHIALVRKHLGDEIVAAAADIAEMDIEDLLAAAEPADHIADLVIGMIEALGYGALAEVQPVIGAFVQGDELLEATNGA